MSKGHAEAENKHMFLMKQLKPKPILTAIYGMRGHD